MKRGRIVFLSCLALALVAAAKPAQAEKPPADGSNEVQVRANIPYYQGPGADRLKHRLDVYAPRGKKDRPVVLFIHGGAWVFGDKDFFGVHEALGRMFARHGIVAIVASYRLSPQVKHPEHVKDVARAFAWTHRHISEYGGRADQIFLCGHSAGGHLISLLATDESYLKAEGRSFKDIKGVLSISGVYEIPPKMFQDVFGTDPEVHKQAGPLTHVKAGCPPFLLLYAAKDYPLCDVMSQKFAKALEAKKVPVRLHALAARNHLDILGNASKDGDPCGRELLDFIALHTRP